VPESKFTSDQALEVAAACAVQRVDYLFIGKSGAILLGYPATTQDVDIFLPKDRENAARMIRALKSIGFKLSRAIQKDPGGRRFRTAQGRAFRSGPDSCAGRHRQF